MEHRSRSREPLYSVIASRAEAWIRAGEWAPGGRLPPERELCRLFDVSRATLRQALAELEERGLITRHQGRGTFVARRRVDADASSYFTIGAALRARGESLRTQVIDLSVVEAGRGIAADLGMLPGDPVVQLERLRILEGDPLLLETSQLPLALFPGLPDHDFVSRSLYDVLREDYGCEPLAASETLEPVLLTPRESGLLGVGRHALALLVHRATTDGEGRTIEIAEALLRGDRSRFLLLREAHGPTPEPLLAGMFDLDLNRLLVTAASHAPSSAGTRASVAFVAEPRSTTR